MRAHNLEGDRAGEDSLRQRLPPQGNPALGSCTGYHPEGCRDGFASSDIFFLEVCFYSMMCANRDELFSVQPGQDWQCAMDWRGFEKMRKLILYPKTSKTRGR